MGKLFSHPLCLDVHNNQKIKKKMGLSSLANFRTEKGEHGRCEVRAQKNECL